MSEKFCGLGVDIVKPLERGDVRILRDGKMVDVFDLLSTLEADNHRLRLGSMSAFDYERLVAWMKNKERKSPETAFTAGMARDAARAFILGLEEKP